MVIGRFGGWVACALLLAAFGGLRGAGSWREPMSGGHADLLRRVRTDVRGAGLGRRGGWTDESKYSTIQLADFNGDGKDELLARNDQGVEIFRFDTSSGSGARRSTPTISLRC